MLIKEARKKIHDFEETSACRCEQFEAQYKE
jgi:hypothetical protein